MSKMFVARKECGCITAIALSGYPELPQDIFEWLERGNIVRAEEHDRLGFERCPKHQVLEQPVNDLPLDTTGSHQESLRKGDATEEG